MSELGRMERQIHDDWHDLYPQLAELLNHLGVVRARKINGEWVFSRTAPDDSEVEFAVEPSGVRRP